MKILKLDLNMYRRTEDEMRGPLHILVEEEFPEIGIATDGRGAPTRGGIIDYALAYTVMVGFIAYFLFFV